MRSEAELQNWALSKISGVERRPQEDISDFERKILSSGAFERKNGTIVTFSMPAAASNSSFSSSE
jgi:hypothetical protein